VNVKSRMVRPGFTSSQCSGMETVAPALGAGSMGRLCGTGAVLQEVEVHFAPRLATIRSRLVYPGICSCSSEYFHYSGGRGLFDRRYYFGAHGYVNVHTCGARCLQ